MEYFTYVLRLANGSFYKGLTSSLDRRLDDHSKGYCSSTKKSLPYEVVYVHPCKNRVEARSWEKYFKSGYGREIISELYAEVAKWYTH